MSKFLAIVSREWRAYFLSPLAYVILAAFLVMNGMIFAAIIAFLNTPGAPKGQALPFLFTNTYFWIFNLFVVPIITMRLTRSLGIGVALSDSSGTGGEPARRAHAGGRSPSGDRPCSCPTLGPRRPGSAT